MRHRRALVAADIADARLQQRLGYRQDALAAEDLAVAELQRLYLLLERPFHGGPLQRSLTHVLGQVGGDDGKGDEDDQAQDVGGDEGEDAGEDGEEAHFRYHRLDDENVHADRRMDQPQLHGHDDDDAEPDRVESQRGDHGKDDRHRQDDHRQRVHQAAQREVHQHDQGEHAVAPEAEAGEERRHVLRRLRHREEIAEQQRAYEDGEDRRGGARRLEQRLQQLRPRQAPAQRADDDGAAGADAARLGRGEYAPMDPADHQHEQQQRRPHPARHREPLAPRAAPAGREKIRPDEAADGDGGAIHGHREEARENPGDEQLADVLLSDEAVDREHGRGREHGAERAAGGDEAGREGL